MNTFHSTHTTHLALRNALKEACYEVLKTFEDQVLTTGEVTELVKAEYPDLVDFIDAPQSDKSPVSSVLFQIASNTKGQFTFIKNVRKGEYVFTKKRVPTRTDIMTYNPSLRNKKKKGVQTRVAEPVTESVTVQLPAISNAPHFSFVGKIDGQLVIKDERENLYVVQPAKLA
jgi:hypothetical protein